MTQLLSTLSPPPEDLGSTPTPRQWLTTHCNSSSRVWRASSSCELTAFIWCMDTCEGKSSYTESFKKD